MFMVLVYVFACVGALLIGFVAVMGFFEWRESKSLPVRFPPTLHLRYDWSAELWRPQPIPFDYDFTIWPGKEHGQPPRIIWLGEQDEPTR